MIACAAVKIDTCGCVGLVSFEVEINSNGEDCSKAIKVNVQVMRLRAIRSIILY